MDRSKRLRTEWLWLAGLVLLVSLHFWFPRVSAGPMHDTYSALAEGKKAFYLLVRRWGGDRYVSVARNSQPLRRVVQSWIDNGETDRVLCLLGPARPPSDAEWDVLLEWVSLGGNILLAAREDRPELRVPELELEVRPIWDETGVEAGEAYDVSSALLYDLAEPDVIWETEGALADAGDLEALVETDGTVQAAVTAYGNGTIVVVASDFVFSNESLAWGEHDNSVLALRLLAAAGAWSDVWFDESLNETGTPKVLGVLLQQPLRPVSVQLLIVLLVFGWYGSRRFGPLLPRAATARRDVVAHTNAVGLLYYRTGDGTPALRAYLRQLYSELKLKQFKGREERVLEPVAVRLKKSPDAVRKLLRSASKAARTAKLDRRTTFDYIRKLAIVRRAAVASRKSRQAAGSPRPVE